MPGDEYCWLTLTTNNLNDAWCDVLRGEYVYVALLTKSLYTRWD